MNTNRKSGFAWSWLGCFPDCLGISRLLKKSTGEVPTFKSWFQSVYAKNAVGDPWSLARFNTCRALRDSGIPCLVWFEDAIFYYGSKGVPFDLYILVPDVDVAAEALIKKGWRARPPTRNSPMKGNDELVAKWRWFFIPGLEESVWQSQDPRAAVLGSAKDWNINLRSSRSFRYLRPRTFERWPFIPRLPELMDSWFRVWLDLPDGWKDFRRHLTVLISYIYEYIAIVKEPGFHRCLHPEHRQLHWDILAGMNYGSKAFFEHERTIRDQIRQGRYQLQQCSASRDDETLVTRAAEARLLAMMPRYSDQLSFDDIEAVDEEDEFRTQACTEIGQPRTSSGSLFTALLMIILFDMLMWMSARVVRFFKT